MATKKRKDEAENVENKKQPLPLKNSSETKPQTAAMPDAVKESDAIHKDEAAIKRIMHASEKLAEKAKNPAKKAVKENEIKPLPAEPLAKKVAPKKMKIDAVNENKKSEKKVNVKTPASKAKATKSATVNIAPAKNIPAKVSIEKVAVEKKITEKALSKKNMTLKNTEPKKVKITIGLRYHTNVGQSLFITGNHPLFGNNNIDDALPMQYVDNEFWQTIIYADDKTLFNEPVVYNYVLKNVDGSVSYDWGNDKEIFIDDKTPETLTILDSWNFAGYFENAFYTKPFKNVLLKNNGKNFSTSTSKNFTHLFKIKAPLLSKDQTICISGSDAALGSWDIDEVVVMNKTEGDDHYTAKLNLAKAVFPLSYKYGVYNIVTKKFEGFENTSNRGLSDTIEKNKTTIVNDGYAVLPNNTWRGAGIAIPVFSLKTNNSFGVGEFADLKIFADWAKKVSVKLIQILPVNDTNATDSWVDSYPYAAISAFALHPMFINLDALVNEKNKPFLDALQSEKNRLNALDKVDYEAVNEIKWKVIRYVYPSQKEAIFSSKEYQDFFENNKHWLVPYAAFCFLRDKNNTADFKYWRTNKVFNLGEIESLINDEANKDAAYLHFFVQYHLHLQLKEATAYAHENSIIIKGDIPIGIYRYSVDAWRQPELFHMDEQAGAPPDGFAVKGQNWGFPTYNWQKMREDGFAWWKQRFAQMNYYFDAFRIDHILGFFRIWSIPLKDVEGIMGHFVPAIPVHINEFHERNIWFDRARYCNPFINWNILSSIFGDDAEEVKNIFLIEPNPNAFEFKQEFDTQRKLEGYFDNLRDQKQLRYKENLYGLLSNVILFEAENSNGQSYHFRFGVESTSSFQSLESGTQQQLRELYVNYFFRRQDSFWEKEAMQKLPALKRSTEMLVCGEDLGLVPDCVPDVMRQLGLLSLEIQRMPKDSSKEFFHPNDAPYLSVVTPSTHDMSTIRAWWEEDRAMTQRFYNNELGQWGEAPYFCEDWVNKLIVLQHLYSPAMWSIFQLQDILGINKNIRRLMPHDERINLPSNPKNYWQYKMHLSIEDLLQADDYNKDLKDNIEASGRA